MRPLLFCLIASGLMEGCGCSETGLEGHADSTVNPDIDHLAEPEGLSQPQLEVEVAA